MAMIRVKVLRPFMLAGGQFAEAGQVVAVLAHVAGDVLRSQRAELVDKSDAAKIKAEVEKDAAKVVQGLGRTPGDMRPLRGQWG